MSHVELVRFRAKPDQLEAMLEARPQMIAGMRAERPGFLEARLVRLSNDEFLDIVLWRSAQDFHDHRAKGFDLPGLKAFIEATEELISSEEGETVHTG